MILKASQRGGPRQLAAHLLKLEDNDHVMVHELRGFVSSDLDGAMAETVAIAKGTHCSQPVFSLSINPPKGVAASIDDLLAAAERAEQALGLSDQPRAVVIHEKNGRRHAHVVWSRIAPEMRAINMPFFKVKLGALSRDLYLEHGWDLPDGHRTNGWKNPLNFTLAEWQQAKRVELDPREIKRIFQSSWARSDTLSGFRDALEEHGYFLAKGDRRGVVAVGLQGEVYSVARWTGLKSKDLNVRVSGADTLPTVNEAHAVQATRITKRGLAVLAQARAKRIEELKPHNEQLRMLVSGQRKERSTLLDKQEARKISEGRDRASRFRRGLGAVMDILTGRTFAVKRQNERETYEAYLRDRQQRETLTQQQNNDRTEVQRRKDALVRQQLIERQRLTRNVIAFSRRRTPANSLERGVGYDL